MNPLMGPRSKASLLGCLARFFHAQSPSRISADCPTPRASAVSNRRCREWALALISCVTACGGARTQGAAAEGGDVRQGDRDHAVVDHPKVRKTVREALGAADRTFADRAVDERLHSAEVLSFVAPSGALRIADLAPGDGYFTELLLRIVGDRGAVFVPSEIDDAELSPAWSRRLARPAMARAKRFDGDLRKALPRDATSLDLVVSIFGYHQAVFQDIDRAAMNALVRAALRSGGRYVVLDRQARVGGGLGDARTLRRIDAALVRHEIEAAGFVLEAEATLLRDPHDAHDWRASDAATTSERGEGDRFVFAFAKR